MKENNTPLKATELRIGNFVLLTKDDFKTTKVYELSGVDIYKVDESDCADIRPIPLTEDWLKNKMNHIETYDKGYHHPHYFFFLIEDLSADGGYSILLKKDNFFIKKIHFVHEYQNFVKETTNTELTIK